jgi:tRNA nucleotidyltransferase/poly(A) polymerase
MLDLLLNSTPIKTVYSLAKKNGADAFLVGGSVRDLHITGFLSTDLDFLVTGNARLIAQQFAKVFNGASFCLDKKRAYYRAIRFDDETIATADFSTLLEDDLILNLMSRDFTINSIGISLAGVFEKRELTFIDPSNGLNDLGEKKVRTTAPSALRDDPLRILRALRFTLKYHFKLAPSTATQINELKTELLRCPWERIRNEFFLILSQPDSAGSLTQLDRHGILPFLLPECDTMKHLKQNDFNQDSLWNHTLKTVHTTELILTKIDHYFPQHAESLRYYFHEERGGDIPRRTLLIFAALLHILYHSGQGEMIGKLPSNNHTHQLKPIIRKITRRFKLSRRTEKTITAILTYHTQFATRFPSKSSSERPFYRFMKDINGPVPDTLILVLAHALVAGSDPLQDSTTVPDEKTVKVLMNYYFEEFSQKRPVPLLTGNDILRILDLKPGKKVGDLLEMIKAAEREGTISSKEDALELLSSAVQKE